MIILKFSRSFIEAAKACADDAGKKAKEGIREFCGAYDGIIKSFSEDERLSHFVGKILDASGLLEYYCT